MGLGTSTTFVISGKVKPNDLDKIQTFERNVSNDCHIVNVGVIQLLDNTDMVRNAKRRNF